MADKYMRMIDNAKSGAELREIEKDIQADSSLELMGMCCATCERHNGFFCTASKFRGRDTGKSYVSDSGRVEKWRFN